MDDYLGKMDDMIEKSASAATGIDYANVDEITRTRLRLPRRMYGGAIRRQQLIAPAAYVGGVVLTLPRMLDRTAKDGQVIKGFMPVLTASLGAGSFDHHRLEDEDHFTTYLHPDRLAHDPTALHFYSAVRKMQEEVAGAPDGTPEVGHLSVHPVGIGIRNGVIVDKFQRALTREREDAVFKLLGVTVSNLPLGDRRASAFNQVDRGSTAIVGSFPTDYTAHGGGGNVVSNTHFALSMAAFYGLPPALLQPFVGKHKCTNGQLLDEYGDNLTLSNMAGDGWRKRHDVFKWGLSRWMSWAKMEYTCEVYGLFAAYINQGADTGISARKRQSIIPDFAISSAAGRPRSLGELKFIGHSKTFFPSDKKESDRCSGVGKRAGTVNSEYLRNARRADIEYNGHDRNSPLDGPIARRIKEYGRVKAFVVGPRAEMSSDLHSLINCISERAAEVRWRGMLAIDVIHAKGVIKTMITNSLGILGARANAECLEDRLGIMVGDGKAAFGRRRSADAANREAYEEYSRH